VFDAIATGIPCKVQHWSWDAVHFEYLPAGAAAEGNNASCVLRIIARDGRSILLPGDIEKPVEGALLDHVPGLLQSNVLVAPHHGSRTSSTPAFVQAVLPELVLFATGYLNRFGFPRESVVERYLKAGARTLSTARSGAIEVRIEAERALQVLPWRSTHPSVWRARPDSD
jgi:competence protein ComEC